MVQRKRKGTNAERELVHMFWKTGTWSAIRVAGSGSIKYPVPDLLAANNLRKLSIECKSTKNPNQYLDPAQMNDLATFARMFGTEAWLGVRFDGGDWFFLAIEDLRKTTVQLVISRAEAEAKGLTFEQLIGNFEQTTSSTTPDAVEEVDEQATTSSNNI